MALALLSTAEPRTVRKYGGKPAALTMSATVNRLASYLPMMGKRNQRGSRNGSHPATYRSRLLNPTPTKRPSA